jgi:uncharacterized protein (DUF362 family)
MTQNVVGITQTANVDSCPNIRAVFYELLGLLQPALPAPPAQARMLIKTNLCLIKGYETGATVDPFLVRCLVDWLLEQYAPAEIIIAESDATHLSADVAFKVLGWHKVFHNVPHTRLLNLSTDDRVEVPLDGLHFKTLHMSRTYMEADYLISLAKLKTHTLQRISCTMKNLFGAWPEKIKITYHPYLTQVICDLTRVRSPDLCLIDGIIAHEGAGPVDGLPKPIGVMIGGTQPIGTDHVCARVMGINPKHVPHLHLALQRGLGKADYAVVGRSIESVQTRFEFMPGWIRGWYALKKHLVGAAA